MATNEKNTSPVDDRELEAAEKEAELDALTGTGTYLHGLKKPFVFEGCSVKELYFDFEVLSAEDSLAIEEECAMTGKTVIVPEISGEYLIRMCVRACTTNVNGHRLGLDAFKKLPLGEYNRIRGKARSFLLRSGS